MKKSILLSVIFVAVFIYVAPLLSIQLPIVIKSYVNDLLCLPIVLETCRRSASWILKIPHLHLNSFTITSVCMYFSVYFEYYLPTFNTRYTSDWTDVLLYCFGGTIFYFLQNKLPQNQCELDSREKERLQ